MLIFTATDEGTEINKGAVVPFSPDRIIRSDTLDVAARLNDFGFCRNDMRRICEGILLGRSLTSGLQPKTAEGQLKYIFGVEALREVALSLDRPLYEIFSKSNIEGVFDIKNGRKIMFQIVDQACGLQDPQPKSRIGFGKQRFVVDSRSPRLFPEMDEDDLKREAAEASLIEAECWYVMASIDSKGILCCELSHPENVTDEKFDGFYERIKIFGYGEFEPAFRDKDTEPDGGDQFQIKPKISRR